MQLKRNNFATKVALQKVDIKGTCKATFKFRAIDARQVEVVLITIKSSAVFDDIARPSQSSWELHQM